MPHSWTDTPFFAFDKRANLNLTAFYVLQPCRQRNKACSTCVSKYRENFLSHLPPPSQSIVSILLIFSSHPFHMDKKLFLLPGKRLLSLNSCPYIVMTVDEAGVLFAKQMK
ncbi:hypothetical protein NPIL_296221 [Nephila pilipes]|uniref:Uncharacterized protein n=1 Tax=Nephila pilipes TaxID=299642 RepID=A0A8X6QH84_NEPPI|nr:hypothetical protein NPIL_296221 [Nephila pilipes]